MMRALKLHLRNRAMLYGLQLASILWPSLPPLPPLAPAVPAIFTCVRCGCEPWLFCPGSALLSGFSVSYNILASSILFTITNDAALMLMLFDPGLLHAARK